MNVSLIQQNIFWLDYKANQNHLDTLISQLPETDLIVLPEMFDTGFYMAPSKIKVRNYIETFEWMKNTAHKKNAAIVGSLLVEENDLYYNRLFFVKPDGDYTYYNKRHLFRMGNEHVQYKQGTEKVIVNYKDFRFCLLICYDLRFPVWSRNTNNYDALIYVANWPSSRADVWTKLLMARAIESQAFVIGVNRVGTDGNNLQYSGNSCVIDYKGNVISQAEDNSETCVLSGCNISELNDFRQKFPAWMDADNFNIQI